MLLWHVVSWPQEAKVCVWVGVHYNELTSRRHQHGDEIVCVCVCVSLETCVLGGPLPLVSTVRATCDPTDHTAHTTKKDPLPMAGSTSVSGAVNPFKMPSDEEVFVLREEEQRQKAMERDRLKYTRVHEKTTWSARIGSAALKTSVDGLDIVAESRPEPSTRSMTAGGASTDVAAAHLPTVEVRVKDNMADYIKKKRKMGLSRMSLATKRQEIRKLEEEAERAEKRISQLEAQIAETAGKFTAFVKHSDMEQVEAQRRADTETKARQEKLNEIKKLNAQIAQVEAERKKHEEQMQSCLEYKAFLDLLTPPNFFKEVLVKLRCEDTRSNMIARLEEQLVEAAMEAGADIDETERRQDMMAALERDCAVASERIANDVEAMSPEDIKIAIDRYDPDRVPMYFTHPDQIVQKFVETEEGNLFLINQCQELEVEIEKISSDFDHIEQKMARIQREKRSQIEEEKKKIIVENRKLKELQERIDSDASGGNGARAQDYQTLIEQKVSAICTALQLGDDSGVSALGLLTQIEVRFEEMRVYIDTTMQNPDFVKEIMRKRGDARRAAGRAERAEEEKEKQEARSRKAMLRSKAPVKKRVGKPVMWRSRPLDQKKQVETTAEDTSGNQDADFFM